MLSHRDFRQQSLDRYRAARRLFARQDHATHSAAAQQFDRFIARDGTGLALELFAAFLAKKRHRLVCRRSLSVIAAAAVGAFDGHHRGPGQRALLRDSILCGLINVYLDFEQRLAALYAIAVAQKNFRHALTVHEGAVGRTQVPQKASGRRDLQQAMVAREEFVFGKIEMGAVATADQEGVVLIESKLAPAIRAGQNS